jgi:hypothetical protein
MKRSCKGCNNIEACPFKEHANECPCTDKCLVKTSCSMTCREYYDFRDKWEEEFRRQLQETWL